MLLSAHARMQFDCKTSILHEQSTKEFGVRIGVRQDIPNLVYGLWTCKPVKWSAIKDQCWGWRVKYK